MGDVEVELARVTAHIQGVDLTIVEESCLMRLNARLHRNPDKPGFKKHT